LYGLQQNFRRSDTSDSLPETRVKHQHKAELGVRGREMIQSIESARFHRYRISASRGPKIRSKAEDISRRDGDNYRAVTLQKMLLE